MGQNRVGISPALLHYFLQKKQNKLLTFFSIGGILVSVKKYRKMFFAADCAVRHSNGNPHKSCMCLSHSNGRVLILKYKETEKHGI